MDGNRITTPEGDLITTPEYDKKLGVKNDQDRLGELYRLFLMNKHRQVYNPVDRVIDFSMRRPTDYKLNKHVKLPKAMGFDQELDCEIRRRNYLSVFQSYKQLADRGKKNAAGPGCMNENNIRKSDRRQNTAEEQKQKHVKKKKKATIEKEKIINLSEAECRALKELKKKVATGQLIVTQTDKSSRFAVMTRKQYLDSGFTHTQKDKASNWREVKYYQGQVNSHVWWLSRILKNAEGTDRDRMMKIIQNHSTRNETSC